MADRVQATRKRLEQAEQNLAEVQKRANAMVKKAREEVEHAQDAHDLEVGRALRRQAGKNGQAVPMEESVVQEEPAEEAEPAETEPRGSGWSRLGNGVR